MLKDAAAVALYGHEAINGVLLVKTKHGSKDGDYHLKVGVSHKIQFDPQMADMVSAHDYANALNRARLNDGIAAAYTDAELQKFIDGSDPKVYPNVNWKDEVFKNTAHETNTYLEQLSRTVLVWHQFRQLMGCLPHAVPHRRLRSGDGLQGQHRYRPAHC